MLLIRLSLMCFFSFNIIKEEDTAPCELMLVQPTTESGEMCNGVQKCLLGVWNKGKTKIDQYVSVTSLAKQMKSLWSCTIASQV